MKKGERRVVIPCEKGRQPKWGHKNKKYEKVESGRGKQQGPPVFCPEGDGLSPSRHHLITHTSLRLPTSSARLNALNPTFHSCSPPY